MVYLKNLNGQVKEYKDHDTKTANSLLDSGRWSRVKGIKDMSPYKEAKKKSKKKSKK
tara:strand:+ start:2148 stop:2318 length:171 start_codon:yes stop_codon:yes gene_type:complete